MEKTPKKLKKKLYILIVVCLIYFICTTYLLPIDYLSTTYLPLALA